MDPNGSVCILYHIGHVDIQPIQLNKVDVDNSQMCNSWLATKNNGTNHSFTCKCKNISYSILYL